MQRGPLLQTIQHEELLQHFGLTGLPQLACQEHLVHNTVHLYTTVQYTSTVEIQSNLVEIEHQVELTNVVEILV